MENASFITTTVNEKREKLRRVLLSKKYKPSSACIESVLDSANFNLQYIIHVTSSISKFGNIITNEEISTADRTIKSRSRCIYGSFLSGRYENRNGVILAKSSMCDEKREAAAIKDVLEFLPCGEIRKTHHLVVYTPVSRKVI